MQNKPKWIKDESQDEHGYWEFYGIDGLIEDDDVIFTQNIAPPEEGEFEFDGVIDNEIKMWQNLKKLIKAFRPDVEVENDFYWNDMDLNVRITVPKTHKLFNNGKGKN